MVVAEPPGKEEAARGITFEQRVRDPFAEVERFAEGQDGRKHEGMAVWLGHGTSTGQASEMQGSMDYKYLTRFGREPSGIDESEIKRLEREHLEDYRYFVQFISTCCSAAAIS